MQSPFYTLRLSANYVTPLSLYQKLRPLSPWSFLLESIEGNLRFASRSLLGFGAKRLFIAQNSQLQIKHLASTLKQVTPVYRQQRTLNLADPLAAIAQGLLHEPLTAAPEISPFAGGLFGFLAYDAIRHFEKLYTLPTTTVPDAYFLEPELGIIYDQVSNELTFYTQDPAWLTAVETTLKEPLLHSPTASGSLAELAQPLDLTPLTATTSRYLQMVKQAQEYIAKGDIFQIVLSRSFAIPELVEPLSVYAELRTINPSPYLYYFNFPEFQLLGASPEVMVRVQQGEVILRPLAGTRPRGATPAQDAELAHELLNDPKEIAEHIMLVDLGRNDLGRVSMPGSVQVTSFKIIERYSHVMHLVSEVHGQLTSDHDAFSALRATFPAGTLSGAPKIRAMELIQLLEEQNRGIYGGAVGYFLPNGDADFAIAIRTLLCQNKCFHLQAGAGIVADSIPEREALETEQKIQALIKALSNAHQTTLATLRTGPGPEIRFWA